jgi:excisionase family DNA binding protein
MTDELRPFLSPDEFAKLMGVSVRHVYRLIKDGHIPTVRLGYRHRIHRDSVLKFVKRGGHIDEKKEHKGGGNANLIAIREAKAKAQAEQQ